MSDDIRDTKVELPIREPMPNLLVEELIAGVQQPSVSAGASVEPRLVRVNLRYDEVTSMRMIRRILYKGLDTMDQDKIFLEIRRVLGWENIPYL